MKFMKDKELVAKYEGASAIYALQRIKKLSKKEKAFDWAVALLTPFPGILEEADTLADLGAYFLVKKENEDILVRVQGENVAEEIITGKMEKKSDKIFVYDGNQYAAYKELISGKVSFVLNAPGNLF